MEDKALPSLDVLYFAPAKSSQLLRLHRKWSRKLLPGKLRMLLDDFVESGEDGRDGVVRCAVVVLRVAGWKLLNKVSHRVFA